MQKNANSFVSQTTEHDLPKLVNILSDLTGYDWNLHVSMSQLSVFCNGFYVYGGSYKATEQKLLELTMLMFKAMGEKEEI